MGMGCSSGSSSGGGGGGGSGGGSNNVDVSGTWKGTGNIPQTGTLPTTADSNPERKQCVRNMGHA